MKIVAFVVLLECDACRGKKFVSGGQREYGELVPCVPCNGKGTITGTVDWSLFENLMQKVAR